MFSKHGCLICSGVLEWVQHGTKFIEGEGHKIINEVYVCLDCQREHLQLAEDKRPRPVVRLEDLEY